MLNRTPSRFFVSLTSLTLLVHCGSDPAADDSDSGTDATVTGGNTTTSAGTQNTAAAANTTNGNTANATTQTTSTTTGATSTSSGNATTGAANVTSNTTTSAGPTATTSTTGTTTGGGGATSDTTTATATTGGPDIDEGGKMNAARGESTNVPQDYLRLGEIRILNNNWGSEDLGCTAPNSTMEVFVNDSGAFGWNFNRGDCAQATDTSHPDFPQVEFGIHPFGIGSDLETSPPFSSTTVLPIQIKDIQSAKITLDNLNIALQNGSSWNTTMEFWLSERNPVTDPNPGVYAEIMAWWGWDAGRWPCDTNNDNQPDAGPSVQAGQQYTLCHQNDNWASGWRYFQFRAGDASDGNISHNFNGTVDVKAFLDYLTSQRGYSGELWLTRMEVGSEIDDNTSGTVSMNNITFEVNGESRSAIIRE